MGISIAATPATRTVIISPPKGIGGKSCGAACLGATLTVSGPSPAQPVSNQPFTATFKLTNASPTLTFKGVIQAVFQGRVVGDQANALFSEVILAPHAVSTGTLMVAKPDAGAASLIVTFCPAANVETDRLKPPCGPSSLGNTHLVSTVAITVQSDDMDGDGVPDALEDSLLARFRPYFLFSNDGGPEIYAPADAALYVRRSELRMSGSETDSNDVAKPLATLSANPLAVLFDSGPKGPSNLLKAAALTAYHINPLASIPGNSTVDPGRHGNDWPSVLSVRNIGLYGHVVPVMMTDPFAFQTVESFYTPYADCPNGQDHPPLPQPRIFYKIEYWQFFGYNEDQKAYIGNHEGDWTTVQVIYDPQADVVTSVMHWAHGIQFRFDITPEAYARTAHVAAPDGDMLEIRGCNFAKFGGNINLASLDISTLPPRIVINDDQLQHAQNNVVRMFQDPVTKKWDHPVAYIENGSHEFFPTQAWSFYGAPKHTGDGYHYLTAAPPNVGEIDAPLTETAMAPVIARYNGSWGTFSRYTDPPPGPPLHKQWLLVPGSASAKLMANLRRGG